MNLSDLERNIHSLEASLGSLEHWLALMTGLVVLGLVIEYWQEIPEAITALKNSWSWKPICVIAGASLITIGVAGELAVQFVASHKETELRTANDAVFAGLNTEAAMARRDAGNAVERASQADERAAENEKEAAQLRKQAEDERLARIKIEEAAAWRRFTKEQQQAIAMHLGRFAGVSALIQYNINDIEAFTFGSDIAAALQMAKLRVSEPQPIMLMREGPVPLGANPPLETGVTITSAADEISRSVSDAVLHEILVLGFDATRSPRIITGSNPVVVLFIQPRPQGPQGEAKLRHN